MSGHLSDGAETPGANGRRSRPPPGSGACADCSLLIEADHRIANHLALLMGYIRLKAADIAVQPANPTRESVGLLLQGLDVQISGVARLHRSLAADGPHASADLGEHLRQVCAPFVSGLAGGIRIVEDFQPGCVVRPDQILPLTQIVAEAVTKAVKHANTGGGAKTVVVSCRRDEAGAAVAEVIDDGGGLPEGFDPQTGGGLGFRLLRAHAKQLGALITFESTRRGLRFRLTLPATA